MNLTFLSRELPRQVWNIFECALKLDFNGEDWKRDTNLENRKIVGVLKVAEYYLRSFSIRFY